MLFGCSVPTAGKLESRWEGRKIKSIKSPVSIEIMDYQCRTKLVHVNRLRHGLTPHPQEQVFSQAQNT